MKKIIYAALLIASIFTSAVAAWAASEIELSKSRPANMPDPGQTPEQQVVLNQEMARIEGDYMRVVKYYNKDLTDRQALQIAQYILYYSTYFKLDPRLVMSVIVVESRFQPRAVSPKGAMGLGQLMPGTARLVGVNNPFDARENVYGTVRYLRAQYERWQSSERVLDLMLASYNAGPEAVARYKGIPPYRETQEYVIKVKKIFRFFVYGY